MIESLDGHLEDENGCFGCNQLAMVAYSASLSGWFNRGIFAPPYHSLQRRAASQHPPRYNS
jgi:hypothetical protein